MTDPGTVQAIAETNDQIILALIALVGTSIAALVFIIRNSKIIRDGAGDAAVAAEQSTSAASAVNHVEFGERRLYEIVRHIESKQDEFDRKWGNLPAGMGDAVALTELLHDMSGRIDKIQTDLVDHVRWEMSQKIYTPPC